MKNLKIDNPCPVLLQRMDKNGDDFNCKSCNKTVFDFRNKNDSELKELIKPNICGVFNSEQLESQQKQAPLNKIIFYSLTLLCFIGFNVKPYKAQSKTTKDSVNIEERSVSKPIIETKNSSVLKNVSNLKEKKDKKNKRRRLFRRKKKEFFTTGCPSF
jgi:hypothetical protein